LIEHGVSSSQDGSKYASVRVAGIAATIADNDEPAVSVQAPGDLTVSQGLGDVGSYSVVLTRRPENNATVVVRAFAPRLVQFRKANGVPVARGTSQEPDVVALTFNTSNWNVPQTIEFAADPTIGLSGFGAGFFTHRVTIDA